MGIRHAKTRTLRGEVFDETRAKVWLSQNLRSPSLPKLSRKGRDRVSLDLSRLATTLNRLERFIQIGINKWSSGKVISKVVLAFLSLSLAKISSAVLGGRTFITPFVSVETLAGPFPFCMTSHIGYYENEVFQSVFDSRSRYVEDSPVHDRFANVEGMHAVPPPMTGNYMPSGPNREVDDYMFTYGPKQCKTSESDSQTSNFDSCESNSSVETLEFVPEPVVERPSFAFVNTVKHVKTPRETVKEQNTNSPSPKANKRDWNSLMSKRLGLGYGFTKKACFICGSFSHLIRDCDFHEKRMAKQVELNKKKGKISSKICSSVSQAKYVEMCQAKHDTYGPKQSKTSESSESNSSVETLEYMPEPVVIEPKVVIQPKVWSDAPIIEDYESDSDDEYVINPFSHLIRYYDFHEKRMAKQAELNKKKGTGQGEIRPVWNNVQRLNHQNKFVPTAVLTKIGRFPVNAAKQNFSSQAVSTSTARKVNTVRPIVNETRPRNNYYKSHSPIRRPFYKTTTPRTNFPNHKVNTAGDKAVSAVGGKGKTAVKTSAGCNWRPKKYYWNKFSKYNGGSNSRKCVDFEDPLGRPKIIHKRLKNKRIVDSGCSRHMTGNKAYLAEYQDYNGSPVAFGGSKCYITGKGKIRTEKLDFEDVCFVKELQHFNLFSVSQMCDKKNKVNLVKVVYLHRFFKMDQHLCSCQKGKENTEPLNKANKTVGPKEANSSAGTQDNIDTGRIGSKSNEKPVDQEEQAFLEELERLKRQEKKASDAAEALRKEFAQDIIGWLSSAEAARAYIAGVKSSYPDSTNYVDQDDSQIPAFEDIYDNLSHGIFTNASYDDEGAVADFTNLETTVNVSPIPTSRIHTIHPTTQILGDPTSAVQTEEERRAVAVQDSKGIEATRIFLAFASYMRFIVYQMDVKSAFLYGKIDEEVYVAQPSGFVDPKYLKKVYKVVKDFYG
ncbi:copia protein [Tanacetum coccineum]